MNHRDEHFPPGDVSEKTLMAYADGQLGAREADALTLRLASDPVLRDRLVAFVATRRIPQFDAVMDRPMPEALRALLTAPVAADTPRDKQKSAATTTGSGFLRALADLFTPGRSSWALGVALSSCLIVGSVGGWMAARLIETDNPSSIIATIKDGSRITAHMLETTLETRMGGSDLAVLGAKGPVVFLKPHSTFAATGDRICREYDVRVGEQTKGYVGVACRGAEGHWTVEKQVAFDFVMRNTKTAGGRPLDDLVEAIASGRSLLPDEEQRLLRNHWRGPLPKQ